jgi:hypothetical protein
MKHIKFTHVIWLEASPYLLSLGLKKSWVAIVLLAGPLSGLIVQPLIGELHFEVFALT